MNYDESENAHNINVIVLLFNQPLPPDKKNQKKENTREKTV